MYSNRISDDNFTSVIYYRCRWICQPPDWLPIDAKNEKIINLYALMKYSKKKLDNTSMTKYLRHPSCRWCWFSFNSDLFHCTHARWDLSSRRAHTAEQKRVIHFRLIYTPCPAFILPYKGWGHGFHCRCFGKAIILLISQLSPYGLAIACTCLYGVSGQIVHVHLTL